MNNKPAVEVFIPAFNEANNIHELLLSVLEQKRGNFSLKKIAVCSDGSTDQTARLVRALSQKYKIITLIEKKKQHGKYARLNEAFRMCKSNIIVVLDADIALADSYFLEHITQVFVDDPGADVVAAYQQLIRPKGFIKRVLYSSFFYWDNVRNNLADLNSHYNYYGSATGYRGSFARSVNIPKGLFDPHLYIYLQTVKKKSFRYCTKAKILQNSITTFKDLHTFLRRSIGKGLDIKLMNKYSTEIGEMGRPIAYKYRVLAAMKTFVKEPFYTPFGLCISLYMGYIANHIVPDKTPVWDIATSTKSKIAGRKEANI